MRARGMILSAIFTLLGLLTMPDNGDGQDKKEEDRFPEKATLRAWDKSGKKFQKAYEDLPVKKIEDKKGVRFSVKAVAANSGQPTVGSEITDKSGDVWVVDKIEKGGTSHYCYVTKKALENKP